MCPRNRGLRSLDFRNRTLSMKKRPLSLLCMLILPAVSFMACQTSVDRSQTVARVGKNTLTLRDLEAALGRMGHYPAKDYSKESNRLDLVRQMISEELLFQEALRTKVHERSPKLKKEIVREFLKERVSVNKYQPSEAEINKLWEEKKDELARIRARHILIKDKAKAEQVLKEIKTKGPNTNIAEFAKKYSEDKSNKDKGGDLLLFNKKQMVPEFSQAAFALEKVGDISELVQTQFGYHIIQLTGDQRNLEHHKARLRQFLIKKKHKEETDKLIERLKGSASIKLIKENIMKAKAPPKLNPHG